jgi:hypothetical protein
VRDSLNSNPVVQAVALGLLTLAVAFLLFTRVVNRDGGAEPVPSEPAPASSTAPAGGEVAAGVPPPTETATPVPAPADATSPAPAGAAETASPPAGAEPGAAAEAAAAGEFVAGPGLPADVVKAYADGDVVVLLIVHRKGIEDRDVERTVKRLGSRGDTAVFVVPAPKIADYSRITRGVDVDRTPALVVLQPRRLSDGGAPVASVSYGFRGPGSVEQAVEDSLYEGRKDLPYYPQ